jgi:hypothetical protein
MSGRGPDRQVDLDPRRGEMSDGREEREEERKRRELEERKDREDRINRDREERGAPERGGS